MKGLFLERQARLRKQVKVSHPETSNNGKLLPLLPPPPLHRGDREEEQLLLLAP